MSRPAEIDAEISDQCARLIANVTICYNPAILSYPLVKCEASGNAGTSIT